MRTRRFLAASAGCIMAAATVAPSMGQTPSPVADATPLPAVTQAPAPESPGPNDGRCADLGLDEPVASRSHLVASAAGRDTAAIRLAQDDPASDDGWCRLRSWTQPDDWALDVPFPGGSYVADPLGDVSDPRIDIVGVGFGMVTLPKGGVPKVFTGDRKGLVVSGKPSKAGAWYVFELDLADAPGPIDGQNPSWNLATDRNGKPQDNVPASIATADNPWQNTQNAVHLLFRPDGAPFLGSSDFAGKPVNGSPFYNDKRNLAAWLTPDSIVFMVPANDVGAQFRAMAGLGSEQDIVHLPGDHAQIPLDGSGVPNTTGCFEESITHEQLVVPVVELDGEELGDVPFPSYITVGDCKRLSTDEVEALAELDEDLTVEVVTRTPDKREVTQVLPVDMYVDPVPDEDGITRFYLWIDFGLTSYGRTTVQDLFFHETGDPVLDRLLADNARYLLRGLAPVEVDAEQGSIGEPCFPPDLPRPVG